MWIFTVEDMYRRHYCTRRGFTCKVDYEMHEYKAWTAWLNVVQSFT